MSPADGMMDRRARIGGGVARIGVAVVQDGVFGKMCPHCGSTATRRLGKCSVCDKDVCERCGSVQHSGGERRAVHRECLRKADGHFTMIKFVR